jgi:hypothetical protein
VSSSWAASLRGLPGAPGPLAARREAVAYLSTLYDGKVAATEAQWLSCFISLYRQVALGSIELPEGGQVTTRLDFSHKVSSVGHTDICCHQVVADPGQRFVLRCNKTFLLGEMVAPC